MGFDCKKIWSNKKEEYSMEKKNYRGFRDLIVFQLSYKLAVEIYELTKDFPKEEKYFYPVKL